MRSLALVLSVAIAACQQAPTEPPPTKRAPTESIDVDLTGIDGIPPLRITIPKFGAERSPLPAAHVLTAGSLATGFMTTVIVRSVGSCFTPACAEPIIDATDRRTQKCATADQVTVSVEHHLPTGNVCCIASWTARTKLTSEQRQITSGIETACSTLRTR